MRPAGPISTGGTTGWWLEWEQSGARSRLPLDRPRWIGRDPTADVRLRDATVSRRHAVVSVVAGQIVVDASTSTNGIQLDRGRADRVALGPGQSFNIGGTIFRVVQAPAGQPQGVEPPFAPLPPCPARPFSSRPAPAPAPAPAHTSNVLAIALAILAVVVAAAVIAVLALRPFNGAAAQSSSPFGLTMPPWSVSASALPSNAPPGLAAAIESFAPPQPEFGPGFVVETIRTQGDWAISFGHAVAGPSYNNIPTETIVVIAHRIGAGWQTTSDRDQGFCVQLAQLPEGILNATERSFYGCD
jgi:hypothetical protein